MEILLHGHHRGLLSVVTSKAQGYDPSTVAHKIKPHMQALIDLGLLTVHIEGGEEIYRPAVCDAELPIINLQQLIGNLRQMEETFSRDDYYFLIARAFNMKFVTYSAETHRDLLGQTLGRGYRVMRDKLTGMADIEAISNWVRISLLAEMDILASRTDVNGYLDLMRKHEPSSVRYHADGKGQIAYVILEGF